MNEEEKLSQFGINFIETIRDNTIAKLEKIQNGKLKTKEAKFISSLLEKSNNDLEIKKIATELIDNVLHDILFFIETNDDWAVIERSQAEEFEIQTLDEISDGLSGELYTEDGWIKKYSKYEQIDDWI